jgi:hypothetical protein
MVWSNCGAPDGQCGSLHQDTAIGNVAVIGNIRGQGNTHGGREIVAEPAISNIDMEVGGQRRRTHNTVGDFASSA